MFLCKQLTNGFFVCGNCFIRSYCVTILSTVAVKTTPGNNNVLDVIKTIILNQTSHNGGQCRSHQQHLGGCSKKLGRIGDITEIDI